MRRFAIVIGANDGGPDRERLRYASNDADALAGALQDLGGIAASDRLTLVDPSPEELRAGFQVMAGRLREARQGDRRLQVLVYYSGHSDEQGLLLGGRALDYRSLRRLIEGLPADVRIAILDSCASGAFTRAKGGKKRAPFIVGNVQEVEGHAYLTSSSADENAQESDRIGGSFFTHYLVTGLRGAADANGDRLVTLSEAYQFAFDETLARTEATRGGAQHAAYEIQLAGSGDLVMTDLRNQSAVLTLSGAIEGRVFVRDTRGQLAAELEKHSGDPIELALEPGHYQVTVDDGEHLRRGEVRVSDSSPARLEASMLSPVSAEETRQRGEATPPEPEDSSRAPSYARIPFNLGLTPGLSINAAEGRDKPAINEFSFNLLWGRSARIDGIQLSYGMNFVDERLTGAQIAMLGNVVRGDASGAQLSAFANVTRGELRGLQFSQGVNVSGTQLYGAQLGLANVGRRVDGVQLGLVNVARERAHTQVGLLNYADDANVSLGLITPTRRWGTKLDVWTSDAAAVNVGVKFRARHTYSFMSFGIHPLRSNDAWMYGVGFGASVPLADRKGFIDLDLSGWGVHDGFGDLQAPTPMGKLRIMAGWRPRKHFAVFVGPTFNVLTETEPRIRRPGYGWALFTYEDADVRIRGWPGFVAGFEF